MGVTDLAGLGNPLKKLITVVSSAIGRLSKSHFDKKDIDTEAYRIKTLAKAVADASQFSENIEYCEKGLIIKPNMLPEVPIENRIQERLNFQEEKKQLNIENVTIFAANELRNEQSVSEEPLSEDWTTRFFRIVEDVSNEEMQMLWGKILAGEIKQPNSFSLRTLEVVRNLSQKEAETFLRVARFAIHRNNSYALFTGGSITSLAEHYKIKFEDIALLIEAGLLQPGDFTQYQLLQQPEDTRNPFVFGNIVMVVEIKANTPTLKMPIRLFTSTGNELMRLVITENPSLDYLKYIAKSIIKKDAVDVKYGYITGYSGDNIMHTPLLEF